MSQTLLAVAALAAFSLLGLQQLRARAHSDRADAAGVLRAAAADVAAEELAGLRAVPFDEALKGAGPFDDPAALTPFVPSTGFAPDAPGDDLDDFDGRVADVRVALADDSVTFAVTTEVRYALADGSDAPAGAPTRYKRATVTAAPVGTGGVLADPVRLSELLSCASPCVW